MINAPAVAGARIAGIGSALPERTVTAHELGAPFGKSAEWITQRTGIERVHRADTADEIARLAEAAAWHALERSGVAEADVDLVVTTSCSVDHTPGRATSIGTGVAPAAPRMHLNSACSGFCYALSAADSAIRSGTATTVLVIAAEWMSSLVDPVDLGTSVVFGDGAGAAVVTASPSGPRIGPVAWGSEGEHAEVISCGPTRGGRLRMAGQQVFRWAVETVPRLGEQACRRAGVALREIEVFAPHQANLRIVDAVATRMGLHGAVVADSVRTTGNTSAASVPIALDQLRSSGKDVAGKVALLAGFGAGLAYAAQVVVLP